MLLSDLPKLWAEPTKIGNIWNKVLQKSKFSKNFTNKSWSPNQIFFTEEKFGKIRPILDNEKWL